MSDIVRGGGCLCGRVRIEARGEPVRVGLCHCLTCRKETGGAFNAYAIWRTADVTIRGETRSWAAATVRRHFCPECGSSVFAVENGHDEIGLQLGAFDDAPSGLAPSYELWVVRREAWQPPLPGAAQFDRNPS